MRSRSDISRDIKKRRRLRFLIKIGEQVLLYAERLKKEDAPGRLYKSTTENKPFFNKEQIFMIRTKVKENRYNYFTESQKKITT